MQHSWEETSSNKTGVLARPKPQGTGAAPQAPQQQNQGAKPSGSLISGKPYSPPSHVQPPNFTSQMPPRQMTQLAQSRIYFSTGVPFELVEKNGAPQGEKYFVFYNPPVVNRQLRHGYNSPFEEFAIALEMKCAGVPTVNPRARRRVT